MSTQGETASFHEKIKEAYCSHYFFGSWGTKIFTLQLMNDMKELFIQYKGILKDLLRYGVLKTEALEHTGLYNGKLGMTILFYEYSRYSGDALYEQFAGRDIRIYNGASG